MPLAFLARRHFPFYCSSTALAAQWPTASGLGHSPSRINLHEDRLEEKGARREGGGWGQTRGRKVKERGRWLVSDLRMKAGEGRVLVGPNSRKMHLVYLHKIPVLGEGASSYSPIPRIPRNWFYDSRFSIPRATKQQNSGKLIPIPHSMHQYVHPNGV